MKSAEAVLAKAERERAAGRAWRAKEILGGAIGGGCAEPAVFQRYGELLEALGDRVEAGKFLFLSGVRTPEYADAIALFTTRHAKRRGRDLLWQLPTAVRGRAFAALPAAVQEDLRRFDVAPEMFGRSVKATARGRPSTGRVAQAAGMTLALMFLVALMVGFYVMFSWIANLFGNRG